MPLPSCPSVEIKVALVNERIEQNLYESKPQMKDPKDTQTSSSLAVSDLVFEPSRKDSRTRYLSEPWLSDLFRTKAAMAVCI